MRGQLDRMIGNLDFFGTVNRTKCVMLSYNPKLSDLSVFFRFPFGLSGYCPHLDCGLTVRGQSVVLSSSQCNICPLRAEVAQLVEQRFRKP